MKMKNRKPITKCLPNKTIGNRLKTLRKSVGWTQKQIADYLEIDQSHVAKLEQGKRNLQTSHIDQLCKLYMIDEDKLISDPNYHPKYNGIRRWCQIYRKGEKT